MHEGFVPEGVGSMPGVEAMAEAAPFVLVRVPVGCFGAASLALSASRD